MGQRHRGIKPIRSNGRQLRRLNKSISVSIEERRYLENVFVQTAPSLQQGPHEACFAHFAVVIEYKGQKQTTELRLPQDIIAKLAFEAEFRDMRIGELIGALTAVTMEKDLLPLILDTANEKDTLLETRSGHFEA